MPLIDAPLRAVSAAASVATLPPPTSHGKLPITVTSPPESDALLRVRSWSWVPPGIPVTCGVNWDEVGPMVTLSPFFGTCMVSQLWESPQLVPSPFPVHVGSADARAAAGASELPKIAPTRTATLSLSSSQRLDHLVMGPPTKRHFYQFLI